MEPKANHSTVTKNCEECKQRNSGEYDCWNPDKMIDTLMRNHSGAEEKWIEKGLPNLVDKMMTN
jgi:hypothetical protein